MPTISDYLRMLRDVEGVHGSFVVSATGTLVDSDLPAAFDAEILGGVGPRIARLFETFFSGGGDMETCMLRYAEHKVYVRRMTWGIVAILASVGVNLPALRMVVNLVVRRIDPEIAAIATATSAPPPSRPPAPGPVTLPSAIPPPLPPQALAQAHAHDVRALAPAGGADPVVPEDGRDSATPPSDRTLMYRGRRLAG